MDLKLLCFPILICANALLAQPSIEWQKCLGGSSTDDAFSICQTSDGGYVLAGKTLSDDGDITGYHGFGDFWVVKLNNSGELQWQQTLGGSSIDFASGVIQTSEGGYLVAGFAESNDGDVSGNHGDKDAWLVKLSATGTIEWQRCYGGSGWEEAHSIQQTEEGGYIMAGQAGSNDGDVSGYHGGLDYWVVKLSAIGNIEWQKCLGGSQLDIAYSIKKTQDGGFIVAGESTSINGDVSGGHGSSDYWVVKLSSTGVLEWQRMLGGSYLDVANDIIQANDGSYLIVGIISSSDGDVLVDYGGIDGWVVKLNHTGEILWQKTIGGSDRDYAFSIQQTNDDGYVIGGFTYSVDGDATGNDGGVDVWLMKLSKQGELLWQKTLGGIQGDKGYSIQQTSNLGYIIAGFTQSNNNGDVSGFHGVQDVWIVKLSPETSGASEQNYLSLSIYPNPASQSVTIQVPSEESDLKVWVYDLFGRTLFSKQVPNGGNLDLETLTAGTFLLKTTTVDGLVYWGKLNKI